MSTKKRREEQSESSTSVFPMQLHVGDRFADETGEWEIISRPYGIVGGKTVRARVRRVGEPAVTEERFWGAYEKVAVRGVNEGGQPMMRWLAAVVVALVLVVPVQAESACAWLLWDSFTTKGATEHGITRAFETKQACEDAIPAAVERHLRSWQGPYQTVNRSPLDPAVVIAQGMTASPDSPRTQAEGDTLLVRVSCWPLGLRPHNVTGGAEYQRSDSR